MRTNFIIFSVTIVCFLSIQSCINEDKIIFYDEFDETVTLQSTSIRQIGNNTLPLNIDVYKDYLILCDTRDENSFSVYKLPDYDFLGKFGKPKDKNGLNSPIFWNQIYEEKGSIFLSAYQMNLKKFTTFDLHKALANNVQAKKIEYAFMPPEIGDAVNIVKLNKGEFIGAGLSSPGEFFVYKHDQDELLWKDFIIDFDENFSEKLKELGLYQEYKRGIIKAKPDKSRFVKVYNFAPIIRVFDKNANVIFTLKSKNIEKPTITTDNFSFDNMAFFNNVYTTDNYFYVVNQNCKLNDVINNDCNSIEVFCFDWDGNPIKRFKLNQSIGILSPLAIDEINKNIYIVSPRDSISNIHKLSFN